MRKTELWEVSRRKFIKGITAIGIATQVGFFEACTNIVEELENPFFSTSDLKALSAIVDALFPDNGNGPNVQQINVIPHITWTLQDKTYGYDAFDMFTVSLHKLKSHCQKTFSKKFNDLSEAEKIICIESISKLKWGDRFLSNTMNYIFEALVLDPSYNVNINEVGWKWLDHSPGQPRPEKRDLFPEFLKRI